MPSSYFIVPNAKLRTPDGTADEVRKYQVSTDSTGRSLSTKLELVREGMSHNVVQINDKYVQSHMTAWGTDMTRAKMIKGSYGIYLAGADEPIYWWPADFDQYPLIDNIINFSGSTFSRSHGTILTERGAKVFILPPLMSSIDYSGLPEIPGQFYIIPVKVYDSKTLGTTVISGSMSFETYKKDWVSYVNKPTNAYFFIHESENEAIVAMRGRPDIVLMPVSKNTDGSVNFGNEQSVKFFLLRYMSAIMGEDLLAFEIKDAAEKVWNDKLDAIVGSSSLENSKRQVAQLSSQIEDALQLINKHQAQLETEMTKMSIMNPENNEFRDYERKTLQKIGCYLDDNMIVYPMKNIRVEHNGKYYMIGDLEITMDSSLQSRNLKVRIAKNSKVYNENTSNPHPNVNGGGGICLGNAAQEVHDALGVGSLSRVFMAVSALLGNYGRPPFSDIGNWPRCTPEGVLLTEEDLDKEREVVEQAQQPPAQSAGTANVAQ